MPTPPQHSVTVSDDSVCVRVELPLVNKAGEVDLSRVATYQFVNKGVGQDIKAKLGGK